MYLTTVYETTLEEMTAGCNGERGVRSEEKRFSSPLYRCYSDLRI